MADIFDLLLQAREAYTTTKDIAGKVTGIGVAPVYDVFDDDTITVLLPEAGGRSPSPPLYRVLPGYNLTYPAVRQGDTVAYGFIEGNANKGIYWGVLHNAVNPPADLANYSYQNGISQVVITPESISEYVKDPEASLDETSGINIVPEEVLIQKKGAVGAMVEVMDGSVVITAGTTVYTFSQGGLSITTGGGSGGVFAMTGVSSATINSKQIATIGAKDTNNDTLTTKGW